MHYIVFDLEWNQCPEGKAKEIEGFPFEIIEIGAIKLDEKRRECDRFHALIKPQEYKRLHSVTREIIHMNNDTLKKGESFARGAEDFLAWCGKDCHFCTWGNLDVMELQRNLKYHNMEDLLPGPIYYYDVQKLYSINYELGDQRLSLEHAVDALHLKKKDDFHQAVADADYTAQIFAKLDTDCIAENYSVDVFQNPKSKKEELHIFYKKYEKYVSREFVDKDRAMRDREVTSTKCPLCHKPAKRIVRWFSVNARNYYSVSWCQEHEYVKGKIRMRKAHSGKAYVIKTLRLIDFKEAQMIQEKQDALRRKRQIRRKKEKMNSPIDK